MLQNIPLHLKIHMKTHTGKKPHLCTQCDYSSARLGSLKRHILTHTGEKPHKCTQCDYSSTRLECIKRHILTHTGERLHQCTQCDYSSRKAADLNRHMRKHTEDTCDNSIVSGGQLSEQKQVHKENTTYTCSNCNEVFTQFLALDYHLLNCKVKEKCKFCDFKCEKVSFLNMHLLKHLYE